MKRSEMLEIIEAVISAPRVEFNAEAVAEEVLTAIEKKGMRLCEIKDLGNIGKLWTPIGWDNEGE